MYFPPGYVRANVLKFANSPTGHKKSFKDIFSQQQMGTFGKTRRERKKKLTWRPQCPLQGTKSTEEKS